jgi:hypothetical protein
MRAGRNISADDFEKGVDRIERFQKSLALDHVLENPYPFKGNQVF